MGNNLNTEKQRKRHELIQQKISEELWDVMVCDNMNTEESRIPKSLHSSHLGIYP